MTFGLQFGATEGHSYDQYRDLMTLRRPLKTLMISHWKPSRTGLGGSWDQLARPLTTFVGRLHCRSSFDDLEFDRCVVFALRTAVRGTHLQGELCPRRILTSLRKLTNIDSEITNRGQCLNPNYALFKQAHQKVKWIIQFWLDRKQVLVGRVARQLWKG